MSRRERDEPGGEDANEARRPAGLDPQILVDLATMRMPFGRYRGRLLVDLPEPYVVWFQRQGFPAGRLGVLLATVSSR
jgi:hypothetical protein